ncbi:MAG: hypothetical protein WC941_09875 [Candidatus Bathyarchaeia archaeon]
MPPIPPDGEGCVKWLVEMGADLGFHAEANYVSDDGSTADAAWVLNPGQRPIFTFTVEEADPMRLTSAALQWVGTSTEPRSWMHIGILLGGSVGGVSLPGLPERLRIYGGDEADRLEADLEGFTKEVIRLLAKYMKTAPSGGGLRGSIKALADSTLGWPRGQPDARIEKEATAIISEEGLYPFTAETSEDDEAPEITLAPSRKVVPLDIKSGEITFDGALMRLTEADAERLLLSSEHRNLPFTFRFSLPRAGGGASLGLWFDADKSNQPQALEFWALADAAEAAGTIGLLGPSGEVAAFTLV